MGDGGNTDNFHSAQNRFLSFLDYFESLENSALILNGDTFEFWQSAMVDVLYNHSDLIERLIKNNAIFIAGNHDYELLTLIKLQLYNNFQMQIIKEIELDINEKTIKITHGNELDPFNPPGKTSFLGKIIALLMASLEERYPGSGIECWFITYIEPTIRKITILFSNLCGVFSPNKPRFNGYLNVALKNYHKDFPNHILVMGHTHEAGLWKDFYINSGSWLETDEAFYVKIDPFGEIQLFAWPSQIEIKKQIKI